MKNNRTSLTEFLESLEEKHFILLGLTSYTNKVIITVLYINSFISIAFHPPSPLNQKYYILVSNEKSVFLLRLPTFQLQIQFTLEVAAERLHVLVYQFWFPWFFIQPHPECPRRRIKRGNLRVMDKVTPWVKKKKYGTHHRTCWLRHAIPKTQDNSLGDSDQIHFTQWRDASEKTDGPI